MTRNRGKRKAKSKKKAAKKAKSNNMRQSSHPVAGSQRIARDEQQTLHSAMAPDEKPGASPRGGDASLTVDRRKLTFNPSVINAHDEGDPDVTLLDVSPAKPGEERNPLFDEVSPVESRGIDIFKSAPARGHLIIEEKESVANSQRSLEDVIADNPDARLSNLDGQTLAFAGHAVRQVVVEATYGFLQSCIPESEQQRVWDQMSGQGKAGSPTKSSITIPDGIMDLKNGVRSTSDLIGNCIGVLSKNFQVTDQKTLKLSLSQAVTLCDAVGDEKRRQALEKAGYELNWLMLGLDCKTMELYRGANRQLDRINLDHPVDTKPGGVSSAGVYDERKVEERNVLQSIKLAHDGFKESFRVRFIETLQSLLAAL
ncbi:hypothetical protein INS49_000457 [Diaporthe citri]|uniref:uncharacterized protein n=1 Tax=Diaporthe citri TaxID=83186 RepID=UPI001C7E7DAE|nr:uncharacterized protein INS49_000457 [Diaporthe citri]KAG6366281.1 hypothetical protein INS49_000457 [Diaporthe citri]